jgi:HAE1 family hydrophobic/amphiphilic exporter-1
VLFVIFQGLQERITGAPVATKENDVALLDEENEK